MQKVKTFDLKQPLVIAIQVEFIVVVPLKMMVLSNHPVFVVFLKNQMNIR